jgi:hypothetical protein
VHDTRTSEIPAPQPCTHGTDYRTPTTTTASHAALGLGRQTGKGGRPRARQNDLSGCNALTALSARRYTGRQQATLRLPRHWDYRGLRPSSPEPADPIFPLPKPKPTLPQLMHTLRAFLRDPLRLYHMSTAAKDSIRVQAQIRANAEELQDYFRDMEKWEKDMKKKEQGMLRRKQGASGAKVRTFPGLRRKSPTLNPPTTGSCARKRGDGRGRHRIRFEGASCPVGCA